MITYTLKYAIGELVTLIHDPEKLTRMVTGAFVGGTGAGVCYNLSCAERETRHYECELTRAPEQKPTAGFRIKTP